MHQYRLTARAFCRYEVAVEAFDLEVVDGYAFGVGLAVGGDEEGLRAVRVDDAVTGLEVAGGYPAEFRLRPERVLVRCLEGLADAGGRLEGQVAEVVGCALEGLEDTARFKLAGGRVGRQDQLSRANVLDVEELVVLGADAVVAGDIRVERRRSDSVSRARRRKAVGARPTGQRLEKTEESDDE